MADFFALKGAIASVALSHDEGCDCLICKAASGDEEAFRQIVIDMTFRKGR